MPFPFFAIRLLRYLFGRRFFLSNSFFFLSILSFLQVVRRGSGALSRPPTPIPPHIHRHTQHLYTPMAPFPDGTRTRADLAVVVERVSLFLPPSTTLPSAPNRHTHTSMARRRFLPSKKSSPFGGIRTH
jgi:hypothetical protein